MTFGLKDTGEELVMRLFLGAETIMPGTGFCGVMNDRDWYVMDGVNYPNVTNREDTGAGEIHEDSDDLGSITTEPEGAAYSRQPVSFGADYDLGDPGNWRGTLSDKTFDFSDSDNTVNTLFVGASFQSQDANDSSANEHILYSLRMQNERDLSLEDGTVTFSRGALSIN